MSEATEVNTFSTKWMVVAIVAILLLNSVRTAVYIEKPLREIADTVAKHSEQIDSLVGSLQVNEEFKANIRSRLDGK